jgi:alcohol dehydrogenase class IV
MMPWFFCPTQVFFGQDALIDHAVMLSGLGKRCLIVTGRASAAASGALGDLTGALDRLGIRHTVFSEVEQNPKVETCHKGGQLARAFGAEFIVGIGGGSPLDAAKGIAAFAANDIAPMALYEPLPNPPLPLAAIPTTAGTGSEANNISVLTVPIGPQGSKKTYRSPVSFPVLAFADPRYTASLPLALTVSTALDAFCHCAESYFSPLATHLTRALCCEGAKLVWQGLVKAVIGELTLEVRGDLLCGSTLAGIAIGHTGTGFPHPLGYNLSLTDGIPHGAACAVFEGEYLMRQQAAAPDLYQTFFQTAELPDDAGALIPALAKRFYTMPELNDAAVRQYTELVSGAGNYVNSLGTMAVDEIPGMLRKYV